MQQVRAVDGQRGFEADDPVGGVGELALFLVVVVGRVIGDEQINRAVGEPLLQRFDISRSAQRRIHLRIRVVAFDRIFGERDVVRADFRRHVDAALLAPPDELDRALRAEMAQVDVSTGALGEENVANDVNLLGFGGDALETELGAHDAFIHGSTTGQCHVLAVFGDGHVEGPGILERRAHELRAFHRPAVIAEGDGTGADHFGNLGERLPLLSDRDRAVRVHARNAGGFALPLHEADNGLIVRDGLGVRHRTDPGESTGRSAVRPRGDGLNVFTARFTQMDMHVDHPGRDHQATDVDDVGAVGGPDRGSARFDASVAQENIPNGVHSLRRIDNASAAQQQIPAHAPPFFAASASSGLPPASK